jgi:predicted molibdopterin-dependent oxidoreductase YjgC
MKVGDSVVMATRFYSTILGSNPNMSDLNTLKDMFVDSIAVLPTDTGKILSTSCNTTVKLRASDLLINVIVKRKLNTKLSLIAFLQANGNSIPHYCYHDDLSIVGNCRVCIVELKTSLKPTVSCAINAHAALYNNLMYYDSVLIKKARENVLEFLLLNHPLDCPICDQGGDCDLQDQSLFFGFTKRRYYNYKRIVLDKNLGPIVKTVMTRCIHCTRCIRFATEITGAEELGVFGRGSFSEIGTYIEKMLLSELSGNVIDLCPVACTTSPAVIAHSISLVNFENKSSKENLHSVNTNLIRFLLYKKYKNS